MHIVMQLNFIEIVHWIISMQPAKYGIFSHYSLLFAPLFGGLLSTFLTIPTCAVVISEIQLSEVGNITLILTSSSYSL